MTGGGRRKRTDLAIPRAVDFAFPFSFASGYAWRACKESEKC
jgi:hypothetical protein